MTNKKRQRHQMAKQKEEKEKETKKIHLKKIILYLFLFLIINSSLFVLFFNYGKNYFYPKSILNYGCFLGYIILFPFLFSRENKRTINDNYLIKERKEYKNYYTIIKIMIVINIFIFTVSNDKLFNFSKITLKIKGTGYKKILGAGRYNFNITNYPNEVKINEKEEIIVNHTYYLDRDHNTIELIWDNEIDNCLYMFYECSDIDEIDLSNFEKLQVQEECSKVVQK